MTRIVLASHNAKKLKEIAPNLPSSWTLISAGEFELPEPEETGTTFVENAIIKARSASLATGLPAIADDSGLEVDALLGAPGIYSSRYSGEDATDEKNNVKLLEALQGEDNRSARFRCVLVYMRHGKDPMPIIAAGTWEGRILETPSGSGGFGYDPIFFATDLNRAVAELSAEDKAQHSHRGKALVVLKELLKAEFSDSLPGL